MARKHGLPWQGSKNRIAEWVVDVLSASHTLVDLFAGLLLSERAAAERAAAQRWNLSDRELAMVAMLA